MNASLLRRLWLTVLEDGARRPRAFGTAGQRPQTGIVMLNMGGPDTTDKVYDYLHRIMTDRDMIQLPFMQDKMGPWIAKRRTPEVQKKYAEIGGGSPILKWTQKQGGLLCRKLDQISPQTAPHKYYVAFRYVEPFAAQALDELVKDGVQRAVMFSQYPQYSCATTGSSFNEIHRIFKSREVPKDLALSVIDRWATHPPLINTFVDRINEALKKFSSDKRDKVMILFSAHSLPLKAVNRGDPYPSEVGSTVNLVMAKLNHCNPYQLVWQSKVGPLPWLGPFTDDAIKAYVKKGVKNFILVPIAFVNEHIETLHELDIEYCKELASEVGVEQIERVAAPNDHPGFIDGMAELVVKHLQSRTTALPKFFARCPHCTNPNCYNSKKWYADVLRAP